MNLSWMDYALWFLAPAIMLAVLFFMSRRKLRTEFSLFYTYLLLQILLGLEPDRERELLRSFADDVPAWIGSLHLAPVQAFGASWDVRLANGVVSVTPA